MQFSRKELRDDRKTEHFSSVQQRTETIDAIFIPQITDMHGIPFEENCPRGCGKGWEIDPHFGNGTYWFLSIDDMAALAVFDLMFYEDTSFGARVPHFFCFGNYGYNMIPYFTPYMRVHEAWDRGTLLGYAWKTGECYEVVQANKPLAVSSISLLPQAAVVIAKRIGCDPCCLTSAIASLDGSHRILPLFRIFEEVREYKPGKTVARSYYECKVIEACALLVDWWEQHLMSANPRIRPADRTAFNLTCAYIREHLKDQITLKDLCQISCVSASKLTTLFKDIEQQTPMQYLRECRMNQARKLLSETDKSLNDISSSIGFVRQGSFSEAFKERLGITPHQYRTLHQKLN